MPVSILDEAFESIYFILSDLIVDESSGLWVLGDNAPYL